MAGRLGAAYGHDFAAVRVHVDGPAAASAQALHAAAYTTSGHIVFAPGRYAPDTASGQRLIAHEAAHVVQQARAGRPQAGIAPIGSTAERQADAAADQFMAEPRPHWPGGGGVPRAATSLTARPWQLHRQPEVIGKGTSVLHGEVGASNGAPAVGSVDVRVGEQVRVDIDGLKSVVAMHAIQFSGEGAERNFHWLQFVYITATLTQAGKVTALVGGSAFPTTAGPLLASTDKAPAWAVDAPGNMIPWYDLASSAIDASGALTIFDAPLTEMQGVADVILQSEPVGTIFTHSAHFITCLMRKRDDGVFQATYLVPWAATVVFSKSAGGNVPAPVVYSAGQGRDVTALDPPLRSAFDARFAGMRLPVQ